MYPENLSAFGVTVSVWNAMLVAGVVLGYPLLRLALRWRAPATRPRMLALRWLLTAYVSALGAQLFAYAFDENTRLFPPASISWLRYYFDPLFAAKTLYGAIVFLPITLLVVSVPWRDLRYREALDAWTPPLFAVLATSRIGCFLQGCCYGYPSRWGLSFPAHAYRHAQAGLVPAGAPALPVVPTQLLEAVALAVLCLVTFAQLRRGRTDVFAPAVVAYSVIRFGLELLRADPDRNAFGALSTSQWIALAVVAGYAAWRQRAAA